jgi:hypothetical protein
MNVAGSLRPWQGETPSLVARCPAAAVGKIEGIGQRDPEQSVLPTTTITADDVSRCRHRHRHIENIVACREEVDEMTRAALRGEAETKCYTDAQPRLLHLPFSQLLLPEIVKVCRTPKSKVV